MFETTNQYRFSMMRCHSWPFTSPWPSFRAQGTLLPHPPWCRDYAIFGRCFGLEFGVVSIKKGLLNRLESTKSWFQCVWIWGFGKEKVTRVTSIQLESQTHDYHDWSWRFSDFSSGNFNVWAQMAARPCWRWKVTATKGNHRWPSIWPSQSSIDQ